MLSWEEIVQNYIIRYSDKIRKATLSLHAHFGIDYFTYHRIDNHGKYTVLVDRPEWAEHYVGEQIYLNDPYLRHPSVYQSGTSLMDMHGSKEYLEKLYDAGKKVLNVDLGVMLIQKSENHVDFFGFCGNKATSALQHLFLNHPQIFSSFAAFFTQSLHSILIQMKQETSSLIDLKGDDFFHKETICPELSSEILLDFYHALGKKDDVEKINRLSKRERQCLRLLLDGKSAKESASALSLSPRTVEYYFENIKDKLSCWSKQEVFELARRFEELGVF
jgi:DNA-binding CsgD family transcriptional regulator